MHMLTHTLTEAQKQFLFDCFSLDSTHLQAYPPDDLFDDIYRELENMSEPEYAEWGNCTAEESHMAAEILDVLEKIFPQFADTDYRARRNEKLILAGLSSTGKWLIAQLRKHFTNQGKNAADALIATLMEWCRNSADAGDVQAMYYLGIAIEHHIYPCEEGLDAALFWYQKAAEGGHKDACFYAGLFYQEGRGTAPDYTKAMQYYRLGEQLSDFECMHQLGVLYGLGLGVERDPHIALHYYLHASEGNISTSFKNIAVFYDTGALGEKDPIKAREYYAKAAALGSQEAAKRLTELKTDEAPSILLDEISEPWEKKTALLRMFCKYDILVHPSGDPDFPDLQGQALVLEFVNPYLKGHNLFVKLTKSFTLSFGAWQESYAPNERKYAQLKEDIMQILTGELGVCYVYAEGELLGYHTQMQKTDQYTNTDILLRKLNLSQKAMDKIHAKGASILIEHWHPADCWEFQHPAEHLPSAYRFPRKGEIRYVIKNGIDMGNGRLRPFDTERNFIDYIYANPSDESEWVTKKLIALLEKDALQSGAKKIFVNIGNAPEDYRLYKELGYTEVPLIDITALQGVVVAYNRSLEKQLA